MTAMLPAAVDVAAVTDMAMAASGSIGTSDLVVLAPVLILVVTGLLVVVADWFLADDEIRVPAALALIGLAGAAWFLLTRWPLRGTVAITRDVVATDGSARSVSLITHDVLSSYASMVVLIAAAAAVLLGLDYLRRNTMARAEFFALVVFAAAGMMLVTMANDLMVLFLSVEAFSLALYVLAAFGTPERTSLESAFKYFVMGAVAAGFLLYGIALMYAVTGTTNLQAIGDTLANGLHSLPLMAYLGLGFVLVGLGFKISLVPFHHWTPDVYEGAPTPVTAFMSAATKAAAFAALLRVLWVAFPALAPAWQDVLALLAVVTMIVGNLAALTQASVKRMLAYSAVAHAGYILVAVLLGTDLGNAAALYYLFVYALMNVGAFAVLVALRARSASSYEPLAISDLSGLSRREPWLAGALALFLIGLSGLPPTAGFVAKWYLFSAAISAGQVALAVAVVLNSVLAAFYYLRPVMLMYMADPEGEPDRRVRLALPSVVVVAVAAVVTALAVLVSTPLLEGAESALAAPPRAPSSSSEGSTLFMTVPDPWEGRD